MAGETEVLKTVLQYAIDQTALANSKKAINDLKKEQQVLVNQVNRLGPDGGAALTNVLKRLDNTRADLKKTTAEAEALRKKLKEVGETKVTPTVDVVAPTAPVATPTNRGAALSRAGQELRMLPSIQTGLGFGTDAVANIIRLVGALTTVAGSFTTLLAIAAPIGVAIGGVALALGEHNRQLEEAKKRTEEYVEALKRENEIRTEVRAAIGTGDVGGINTRIAELEGQRRDIEQTRIEPAIAKLQAIVDAARADATEFARRDLATGGLTPADSPERFAAAVEEELLRILEGNVDFGSLTQSLTEPQDEVKVLVDRLEQLRQVAREGAAAIQALQAPLQQEQALRDLERRGSSSVVRQQLEDLKTDQNFLVEQIHQTENAIASARAEGNDELAIQLDIFKQQTIATRDQTIAERELLALALPLIEARERETALIQQQIQNTKDRTALELQAFQLIQSGTVESVDARLGALNAEAHFISQSIPRLEAWAETSEDGQKALDAANARMFDLNNELNTLATIRPDVAARQFREETEKLAQSLVNDLNRIEQARDTRIAQIEADLSDKETQAFEDREEARTEAQAKANEEREEQEQEHHENLRRIVRKANVTIANAIASRDALAAFLAEQQKKEEIDTENEANKKRLDAIDKSLDKQNKTIQKRYDDQLKTARDAAEKAIRLERSKAEAEISLKIQAYNVEIQALQNNLFGQFALQQQFWAASIALAQRAVNQIMTQDVTTPQRQYIVPQVVPYSQLNAPVPTPYQYQIPSTYQFREKGGDAQGWTMVGERGRELVYFPDKVRVVNNRQTERMMANGMGGGIGQIGPFYLSDWSSTTERRVIRAVDQRIHETFVQKRAGG